MQEFHAHSILVQRLRSFAQAHLAAHDQAVGILAAGVTGEQAPGMRQTCVVIAQAEIIIGKLRKQGQIARPQALAFDEGMDVGIDAEIAAVEADRAIVGIARRGQGAQPPC